MLVGRRHGHQVHVEIVERGRQMSRAIILDRREIGGAARVDLAIVRRQIKRFEAEAFAESGQVPVHHRRAMIDDDVLEFHQAPGQRGAQLERSRLCDRECYAIARFDMRDGVVSGNQARAELRAPVEPGYLAAVMTRCSCHYAAAARLVSIPISRMKELVSSLSSPTFCMLVTTV